MEQASGVLIKQSSLSTLAIVGGRSAIAALVLWLFVRRPRFAWSAPQIGGAIAYFFMVVFFVQATVLSLGGQRHFAAIHGADLGGDLQLLVSG